MNDSDIKDLFASPLVYGDAEAFEGRVMRGLQMRLWLRQWLVVLAGFTGGLYALAQMVRLPALSLGGKAVAGTTWQQQAVSNTDNTLKAGARLMDVLYARLISLTDSSAHTVGMMQTPLFFWISFSLCLILVGLYYAYSQEEAA